MFDRGVRARCLEVIRALPMPRPFDLERFRLGLGCARGRALHLVAAPGTAGRASGAGGARKAIGGLWIATADEDYIFYPRDAPAVTQLHVIARELGHLLLGHEGAPAATSEIARLLLPSIEPGLVVSTLTRTRYSTEDEEEAELFALLLLDHVEVEALEPASTSRRSSRL